jgi:hypothetical protein
MLGKDAAAEILKAASIQPDDNILYKRLPGFGASKTEMCKFLMYVDDMYDESMYGTPSNDADMLVKTVHPVRSNQLPDDEDYAEAARRIAAVAVAHEPIPRYVYDTDNTDWIESTCAVATKYAYLRTKPSSINQGENDGR